MFECTPYKVTLTHAGRQVLSVAENKSPFTPCTRAQGREHSSIMLYPTESTNNMEKEPSRDLSNKKGGFYSKLFAEYSQRLFSQSMACIMLLAPPTNRTYFAQ